MNPPVSVMPIRQGNLLYRRSQLGVLLARRVVVPIAVVGSPAHPSQATHLYQRRFALLLHHSSYVLEDAVAPRSLRVDRDGSSCRKARCKKSTVSACCTHLRSTSATRPAL